MSEENLFIFIFLLIDSKKYASRKICKARDQITLALCDELHSRESGVFRGVTCHLEVIYLLHHIVIIVFLFYKFDF